ncbi:MAG: hypothetical protein NTY79_03400, partial [Chloroflexi bacterium]|nr:hypothetical protein [Chloroflexota bacterium]
MEIALQVQNSYKDRLSVQYINSCESSKIGKTCCSAGSLYDVAHFYTATGRAIPWSNTNANWQDGSASCSTSCNSISTTPYYPIQSISERQITTQGISQATAISNIKGVLNQNKGVWFAFYGTNSDMNTFGTFWYNQSESIIWSPAFTGGHVVGHAVLCVGYNDDDPNNRYWIMLNSWGTAYGNRPNGLFRLNMNMNYDFKDSSGFNSYYWQTLDMTYTAPASITVTSPNGGESWNAGSSHALTWTYNNSVSDSYVKIYYQKGSATPVSIGYAPIGSAGSGSYNWAIPSTLSSGA